MRLLRALGTRDICLAGLAGWTHYTHSLTPSLTNPFLVVKTALSLPAHAEVDLYRRASLLSSDTLTTAASGSRISGSPKARYL